MNLKSLETPDPFLREEATKALQEAVAKVIAEHKRNGVPLVIYRDGKVVEISPEEAQTEYETARGLAAAQRNRTAATNGISAPPGD